MFGKRLKELRKKNLLTQSDLAKNVGISPSAIGMYEQGHREPDNHTLLKICDIFGVTADYLINSNLKQSIFFSPDDEHDLDEIINLFTETLIKQNNITYKKNKLTQEDLKKVCDAIKIGVNYSLNLEGFSK